MDERRREVKTALHAARIPGDAAVGGIGEVDDLEEQYLLFVREG